MQEQELQIKQTQKIGFLNYIGNNHIDGWIWLGDNAYELEILYYLKIKKTKYVSL
jgi:hypothetical protein